ncbi:MAG: LLM class flavin-dependent oxidoreductase [Planctomycetaceae bacterium]
MTVRIGVGLFTGQVPAGSARTVAQEYRDTVAMARLAESLGFDGAWVSEHHGASDGYLPSLLVMLAALAEATTRIRLGTGVVLTPLHDPVRLAEDAGVVDQLSEGRLVLGLGLGWREEEFRMLRIPQREALARHVETVEILRRAWSGERFSFRGEVFSYDRIRVTPPPYRDGGPPILLGGYVDAALRRAGAIGDGHLTDADDAGHLARAVELMDAGAREAGKDPASLSLVLMQNVALADDGDPWSSVRDGVVHQIGAYAAWDQGHDTPDHDALEPPASAEADARAATLAGTPEEVAAALRPVVDAYGDRDLELVLRFHYPGMALEPAAAAMRLAAERLLPALRG